MLLNNYISVYIGILLLLSACHRTPKQSNYEQFRQDSALVIYYITKGDSIYKQKTNYSNFSKSLELFDSAWQIAQKTDDTNLLAKALFAKGRAYDAINYYPQKTIECYSQASKLYETLPHRQVTSLYIKHLVAHGYDKIQDSANCIKILKELYRAIIDEPDSIKKQLRFTTEMALISTVVKNYNFAEAILAHLNKREWIQNDSSEYDYLNHYYLTKAKINVYQDGNYNSPYLDSLETVFRLSQNLNDSMYYSNELWELYKKMGNESKESYYLNLNNTIFHKFNSPQSIMETKNKLIKMEVAVVEAKQNAELEKSQILKWSVYSLIGLLSIISLLAIYLQKRNKEIKIKQMEVVGINQQLYQKNLQNELLNKEIHHRVKNNLQMIMSLVYMQENKTDTKEVKTNMQNIRLRIESISNLHQQLIGQNDVVDFKTYIQYLVRNATNLMADNKKVITHLYVESMHVPQKIIFPIGLIINEWITNSIKYAQPIGDALEITVNINNEKDISIDYYDNGQPEFHKSQNQSMGLEIIQILTEQLEAKLESKNDNMFHYKLTIPLTDGK